MSHDWPRRAIQAARHGDSAESLFADVPGHSAITSNLDSFLGNERFWETLSWAVPRAIGAGFGSAVGTPSLGFGLGGMLASRDEGQSAPVQPMVDAKDKEGNVIRGGGGGGGATNLFELLSMMNPSGGSSYEGWEGGRAGRNDPYIGGGGLI
jgi:hypothetical protein